jgi:hypothetical protein
MADIIFEQDTWKVSSDVVYGPITENTLIRTIAPVITDLQEKDKQWEYWKSTIDYNSYYQYDPAARPNTYHALTPYTVNVPLIETGFNVDRTELARIGVSKLKIEKRFAQIGKQIQIDEERLGIRGDPDLGTTSFEDTTNNSTAASQELNVTTKALLLSTLTDQIVQLGDNFGGLSALKRYPLICLVSDDVFAKAIKTSITGYARSDDVRNVADLANQLLLRFGAPGSEFVGSKYLGATITRSEESNKISVTSGTTNSVLYPYTPEAFHILASPLNTLRKSDPMDGLTVDITERWLPVFPTQTLVLYGGTAVIA